MAVTIIATPNAANANSYVTLAEFQAYLDTRLSFATDPTSLDDDPGVLLTMATRSMDALFRGARTLVVDGNRSYYRFGRKWAGTPSTTTQRLAFGRIGLFHGNGAAVAADEIPWELKDAVSEFAGQLAQGDRTLDNDVSVGGITGVRAGSVSVSFRNGYIPAAVLPQAVTDLLPPSWYTEEQDMPTQKAEFEVVL